MTTEKVAASDMFDFYLFPLTRQQYSLRKIDLALVDCDDEFLCERVAEAIRLGEHARQLDHSFTAGNRANEFGPEAQRLDRELARALGAVATHLSTTAHCYGEASSQAQLAHYVSEQLFPEGVRAVTHLRYVDEEETVRTILQRVETDPDLKQAVRELGADRFLERVAEVHARYGQALNKQPQLTYAQMRQIRREGQERLCRIMALVLARLVSREDADEGADDQAAALWQALRAVKDQNAAIGRYYKRRRRVTEVDPETGEELEAEFEEEIDEEFKDEAEFDEEDDEEDADDAPSPFTAEDVAAASDRVIEAIEELGERVAEPWNPDADDDEDVDVA